MIKSDLIFLTTVSGGRINPVESGYKSQFFYNNQDWDVVHDFSDVEKVYPGDVVNSKITFLNKDVHIGKIYIGMPFLIREGVKTIAFGVIKEILDNNYENKS